MGLLGSLDWNVGTICARCSHKLARIRIESALKVPGGGGGWWGGSTQVCKLYGDVPPKWVVFPQEILRHGPLFRGKIFRNGYLFWQK